MFDRYQPYSYVHANPLRYADPDGHQARQVDFVITMSPRLANNRFLHAGIDAYAGHLRNDRGYVHIRNFNSLDDVLRRIAANLRPGDTIGRLVILTHGAQPPPADRATGSQILLPGSGERLHNAASLQAAARRLGADLRTVQNAVRPTTSTDLLACTVGVTGQNDPLLAAWGRFLGGGGILVRAYGGNIVGVAPISGPGPASLELHIGPSRFAFPSEQAERFRVEVRVPQARFPNRDDPAAPAAPAAPDRPAGIRGPGQHEIVPAVRPEPAPVPAPRRRP